MREAEQPFLQVTPQRGVTVDDVVAGGDVCGILKKHQKRLRSHDPCSIGNLISESDVPHDASPPVSPVSAAMTSRNKASASFVCSSRSPLLRTASPCVDRRASAVAKASK